MRYLPHTRKISLICWNKIGVESLDALFSTVPDECRRKSPMKLPEPLTEWELDRKMAQAFGHHGCFTGIQSLCRGRKL
jgi:glycine dehydrogenase subunit 1